MTLEQNPSTIGDESALVKEIHADAKTKADRARRRAERDAQRILGRAEKEAAEAAHRLLDSSRLRAEREALRQQRIVNQEVKRRRLSAREKVLDDLFAQALAQLQEKAAYDYRRCLVALAADAIGAMRGDTFELHLSPQDAAVADGGFVAAVQAALVAAGRSGVQLEACADTPSISGGVQVCSKDGHQVFDNSFEARLARQRPALRSRLASIVYGAGPGGAAGSKE